MIERREIITPNNEIYMPSRTFDSIKTAKEYSIANPNTICLATSGGSGKKVYPDYLDITIEKTTANSTVTLNVSCTSYYVSSITLRYDAVIDWGDGEYRYFYKGEIVTYGNVSHTYKYPGTYHIKIYGVIIYTSSISYTKEFIDYNSMFPKMIRGTAKFVPMETNTSSMGVKLVGNTHDTDVDVLIQPIGEEIPSRYKYAVRIDCYLSNGNPSGFPKTYHHDMWRMTVDLSRVQNADSCRISLGQTAYNYNIDNIIIDVINHYGKVNLISNAYSSGSLSTADLFQIKFDDSGEVNITEGYNNIIPCGVSRVDIPVPAHSTSSTLMDNMFCYVSGYIRALRDINGNLLKVSDFLVNQDLPSENRPVAVNWADTDDYYSIDPLWRMAEKWS